MTVERPFGVSQNLLIRTRDGSGNNIVPIKKTVIHHEHRKICWKGKQDKLPRAHAIVVTMDAMRNSKKNWLRLFRTQSN